MTTTDKVDETLGADVNTQNLGGFQKLQLNTVVIQNELKLLMHKVVKS